MALTAKAHVMVHLQLLERALVRDIEVVQLLSELVGCAIEGFGRGSAVRRHKPWVCKCTIRHKICRSIRMNGGPYLSALHGRAGQQQAATTSNLLD